MAITSADFEFIRTLIHKEAAIVLEPGKDYLVESRLAPLAVREGFGSLHELVERLRSMPSNGHLKKVVDAMTTNETSFFRDIAPFEILQKKVFPELLEARKGTRELSIWCGASSTGQEPYTVAMMMQEHFPQLSTWKVQFLATDLSSEVLQRAATGRFSQLEVNRGLPVGYLVKYFEKQGVEWQIKEPLRRMVRFQEMNLVRPWPAIPRMDLVMLRNVLIYFDMDSKKRILHGIRELLRPDGYLFLGGAETTINLDDRFERMPFDRAGCYRLRR